MRWSAGDGGRGVGAGARASGASSRSSSSSSRARSWPWRRPSSRSSDPCPGSSSALFVVGALFSVARGLRGTGTVLDEIVDATRRVQDGRLHGPGRDAAGRDPATSTELVAGFNTMTARLEADEAHAAGAPRRRQPRTADAADGHRRQPRGPHRRRLPGRRGAPRPDPRPDPGHGAAHRRPAHADPVRGRDARPPPRTDGPGPAHRRRGPLVRGDRDGRRGDAHRRHDRRPADRRRGPGPDRRGPLEPGRERAPAHAGGREP